MFKIVLEVLLGAVLVLLPFFLFWGIASLFIPAEKAFIVAIIGWGFFPFMWGWRG